MVDVATTLQQPQATPTTWEPRIIGFLCYWCSYTGADSAGTARMKYPPNVDIIKVMCSGRIDPELITTAFANGADGVIVLGCHIGDCHYISGNVRMQARMKALAGMLEKLGLSPERFRVDYVSSAEGEKFANIVKEMTEQMKALGKEKIDAENAKLRPTLDNMLKRKAASK